MKRWTDSEIAILKAEYEDHGVLWTMKKIDRTRNSISKMAGRLGLKMREEAKTVLLLEHGKIQARDHSGPGSLNPNWKGGISKYAYAYKLRSIQRHPEKNRARIQLRNAIKSGKIIRQPCCQCGNPVSEAHHDDYSKPLIVIWLCRKHHVEADERRRKSEK